MLTFFVFMGMSASFVVASVWTTLVLMLWPWVENRRPTLVRLALVWLLFAVCLVLALGRP